ncbi:P-loop containing nucleoside triphosphate hydrolase protein [Aspergillus cavernicola]|uniref:P-loop containing nucleoside triphosphate hydrolase protein n=1 Tax=Aspergillus cavernicola TaxID=176166 RepID=A0ABR4IMI9_9EURO
MMRPRPVSSLQKTYDDCYLMCSTAVYFEGQNNEEEALRSWRSALDTIYYHNAYRLPASYTPSTETERALQDSIRQLELQCRERVDLLDALCQSRKDSSTRRKRSPPRNNVNATPGYIGDGTVPAVGYTDLSKPPAIPTRPLLGSAAVSDYTSPTRPAPVRSESQTSTKSSSRTPSPDRRRMLSMPSTLRDGTLKKKKKDTSRRRDLRPVAASQAAGLAWGCISRTPSSDKTASDAALASSRHTITNDLTFRRDSDTSRTELPPAPGLYPSNDKADVANSRRNPDPFQTEFSRTHSADDQLPRRSPMKLQSSSTPGTPKSKHRTRTTADLRPNSNNRSRQPPSLKPELRDPPRSSPSLKPVVKPKPATLRTSQPSDYVDKSEAKETSRPRGPRDSDPVHGQDLVHGLNKMTVSSASPVRRRPLSESKRPITPPSSDPDSLGRRSTDTDDKAEGRDEDELEDSSIMDTLKKLPRGVDVNAARQVLNDIVVRGDEVHWEDIAGLDAAKKALKEAVVYPFLRPDLFSGLREPARGMLLFGPPGTGKTMLARAVATESKSTFFSVSASTLTSKWHGESEKLVRALFGLAKSLAPSIIFVDEIDSLLSARSSGTENEASRRSKTEFLIQWSDLQRAAAGREQPGKSGDPSRVLVLAATNMPWDIDEAARRRFVRRQYIPLPEHHVREQQLRTLISHQVHDLDDEDIEVLVHVTESFSGSDITALAKDAAMGPLRNLGEALLHTPMDQIRPICFADFKASLLSIRPSVSKEGLRAYEDWAGQFGERGG